MKFTKQIKEDWLKLLKSKKYVQGFGQLRSKDNSRCCLGVFCDVLNIEIYEDGEHIKNGKQMDGYKIFEEILGEDICTLLYRTNDRGSHKKNYPRDYSNVIPRIEKIETVD